MFTAEEFENCDIFPKKITSNCVIKFLFYLLVTSFSIILMYSFYSGKDFIALITLESMSYSGGTYFSNRLALNSQMEMNRTKYNLKYSNAIGDIFFKKYINKNFPCLINNATLGFNVFPLYNDIVTYLKEKDKEIQIEKRKNPFHQFYKKGFQYLNMTYSEYLSYNYDKDINNILLLNDVLIDNFEYNFSRILLSKYIKSPLLLEYLELKGIYYTEGRKGVLIGGHSEQSENFVCVIKGLIDMLIISGTGRKYLYPYKKEYGPSNYSPIYFFNPDNSKFPLFKEADRIHIQINEGDCIYIPSYYWRSIKSKDQNYTYISFKYLSPSRYLDSIFNGIENDEL